MIRLVLADDHAVLREGIRRGLEGPEVTVLAEVGDGHAAVRAALELHPDAVLMDLSLPKLDGLGATRRLQAECPDVAVVVLTMFAEPATVKALIRAGAKGFLVKDCTMADILETLRGAVGGQVVVPPWMADAMKDLGDHDLSEREVEVLRLVASGASTAEVARRLFISIKTVRNHLSSIYEKVDARGRTQAVLAAQRLGLVGFSGPAGIHHS